MSAVPDGDLVVDVLIIGGGIQGLYVARSLAGRYSVCVLSDPATPVETLDSLGYISAGYEGNDAVRMQPARRSAGYWRLWAQSNGVPHDYATPYYVVPPAEEVSRPRLWSDAALNFRRVDRLPEVFAAGSLWEGTPYVVEDDVVINPARLLANLYEGLEDCCISGSIVRFGLSGDEAIDHVQVEMGERLVPIVPRFTVLAAGVGNATLLGMLGKRFSDQAVRKERQEVARSSQAVRRSTVISIRGRDLPLVSGWYDGLCLAAHPLSGDGERVWLIAPPVDDAQTKLGPDDLRFELSVESSLVASTLERLFTMTPEIRRMAGSLRWNAYVGRRTQHPSLAAPEISDVAQPVPAKLESFGLDAFLALWPSHLGYSMVLGDVAAERIADNLGRPLDATVTSKPTDFGERAAPHPMRWDAADFTWQDWSTFAAAHGIDAGT